MQKRPNILFILSDQHNPHFLGFEDNSQISTPNLDHLASQGASFRTAYTQNPLCVPGRACLISGQYSRTLGIYHNRHIMEANSMTIPRALSQAGYRTCLIGKSHFNGEQFHGYQQRPYGDLFGQAHQPDPRRTPEKGPSGLGGTLGNSGPSEIPISLTQTAICVAEATKWLQTHISLHKDQPFFLSLHFDKPHFPFNPPREYYEKYKDAKLPDFPLDSLEKAVPFVRSAILDNEVGEHYGKSPENVEIQQRSLAAYCGCVEWVDHAIGRVLDVLSYLNLDNDTVVIYSSDHGEMAGEHGFWQKTLFFDASARIPLIVRWPQKIAAGKVYNDPVGLIDMFPTLCDAANIPVPDTCEGISLLPLLTESIPLARDAVFSESAVQLNMMAAGCMLRTEKWKYNYYLDGSEELYDMENDPDEWRNLATDERFRSMANEFKDRVISFWHPEEYVQRYHNTPIMKREKHFYPFSNQFMLGDGTVVDAQP